MAVKVGSAKINEKGTTTGGAAGDQTGGEVATQNWYLHSKGWVVIRPKSATVAEKIAKCMEAACTNNKIGYCQTHRGTLTTEAKKYGYDVSKVTKAVEVDCSELVRVCCLYAGISVTSFSTATELSTLEATGKFEILTDSKYCTSSAYLKRGDILVTKTKGHTVVVLGNGSGASSSGTSSGSTAGSSSAKVEAARSYNKSLAGTYVVNTQSSNLMLRAGAGTSKAILAKMPKGVKVQCYGYYTAVGGVKWLYVVYDGVTGFASAEYLKKQ